MKVAVITTDELYEILTRAAKAGASEFAATLPKSQPIQAATAPDELLSIAKACEMLDVTRPTIRSWIKRDLLKPRLIGRRIFLLRSELLKQTEEAQS